MAVRTITYRKIRKYKYQLMDAYTYELPQEYARQVKEDRRSGGDFVVLTSGGQLRLKKGYAWDGPSGPTVDTKTFMRGSLVHDAFYQLLRAGHFDDHDHWREVADRIMRRMCIDDGMTRLRAWYVYRSLRAFAKKAARKDPYAEPPILTAPDPRKVLV